MSLDSVGSLTRLILLKAGITQTRLPSESLNRAASPPPGIWAMPFSVRVSGGVVLLELHAAAPHLFDGYAHVGHMEDGLGELP
jgi:hypothetical protein